MKLIQGLLLFIFIHADSFCIYDGQLINSAPQPGSEKDSLDKRKDFGTVKIDPLQVILSCEIPASLEIYLSRSSSLQVQAGFIFPARENAVRRGIYESYGENNNAATSGMFYYRNCPYNNDGGFSVKTELRLFFRPIINDNPYGYQSGYFAIQAMYKKCHYDNLSVYLGSPYSYTQTESKKSNILGFLLVIGKQKDRIGSAFVTDLYGGIGFKTSHINYTILGISPAQPPWFPVKPGQTGTENIGSLYLCFGYRVGFKL